MLEPDNISTNKEIPNYLFFSLKHRLILINYNLLLIIIGTKVIDYINEWNLLKNNKVSNYKKYYINYLNNILKEEFDRIQKIEKQFLAKSLLIFNKIDKSQIWSFFFEDYTVLEKMTKKIIKKHTKYTLETDSINFESSNFYKSIKIIEINGDEEEFLKKTLAKFKY